MLLYLDGKRLPEHSFIVLLLLSLGYKTPFKSVSFPDVIKQAEKEYNLTIDLLDCGNSGLPMAVVKDSPAFHFDSYFIK